MLKWIRIKSKISRTPPQKQGVFGGVTPWIFSPILIRLTWNFFWEDFIVCRAQKKFFVTLRIFYARRIFYEIRLFCKKRHFWRIFRNINYFGGYMANYYPKWPEKNFGKTLWYDWLQKKISMTCRIFYTHRIFYKGSFLMACSHILVKISDFWVYF